MNDLTCAKQFKRDSVSLILTKLDSAKTPDDFLAQIDELSTDPDLLLDRDPISRSRCPSKVRTRTTRESSSRRSARSTASTPHCRDCGLTWRSTPAAGT